MLLKKINPKNLKSSSAKKVLPKSQVLATTKLTTPIRSFVQKKSFGYSGQNNMMMKTAFSSKLVMQNNWASNAKVQRPAFFSSAKAAPICKISPVLSTPLRYSVPQRFVPAPRFYSSVFASTLKSVAPKPVLSSYLKPKAAVFSQTYAISFAQKQVQQPRFFSSGPPELTKEEVTQRVIDAVKNFEKVDGTMEVTVDTHFQRDLGLDSLDVVEIGLALEETFAIEVPDQDAEGLHTVGDWINYIFNHPRAK